jgi:hypothetical protein
MFSIHLFTNFPRLSSSRLGDMVDGIVLSYLANVLITFYLYPSSSIQAIRASGIQQVTMMYPNKQIPVLEKSF